LEEPNDFETYFKNNPNIKAIFFNGKNVKEYFESYIRKERQRQGIELVKLNNKHKGRKNGSRTSPKRLIEKYADIVDLLKGSDLSLRRIAAITNHSVNTVRRIKSLIEL